MPRSRLLELPFKPVRITLLFHALKAYFCVSDHEPQQMRRPILTLSLFLGLFVHAQEEHLTLRDTVLHIHSVTQFNALDATHQLFGARLEVLAEDDPLLTSKLKALTEGDTLSVLENGEVQLYRFLERQALPEYRASYIYLDGAVLGRSQIDSLRSLIIARYKSGTPFADLVSEYTMDGNPNQGDLGWFAKGDMVPEFESAVREHEVGAIFTVNVPHKQWYHVALKTHANREKTYRYFIKIYQRLLGLPLVLLPDP